jgi:pyroglutamyl-peptidase
VRLLVTGFGPFGSVVDNPSEALARHFHGVRIRDRVVTGLPLPTSFARATEQLLAAIPEHDAVLMLGVAEQEKTLRIETMGLNFDDARIADIDGEKPMGAIDEGPSALPVTMDVARLAVAFATARIPFSFSQNAGAYVCNHTLYRALSLERRARVGFIHVPLVPYRELVPAIELAISVV